MTVRGVAACMAAVAAAALLGWTAESAAQGSDQWTFRAFSSAQLVAPVGPLSVSVDGGAFTVAGVPCPRTGTFTLTGRMSGTAVTGTATGQGGCLPASVSPGRLNVAFPASTGFDNLQVSFSDSTVVTISGTRNVRGPESPLNQAKDIADIAVITTSVQNRNIGLRLNSLRSGLGGGVSVSGLALAVQGESAPVGTLLAGMLAGNGGGASDPSKAFGRLGIFVNGQGSFGDRQTTAPAPGFDFFTAGLTMGADYRLTDQVILGAAFGYLRTRLDRVGAEAESRINGYSLSAYGTYYVKDRFYVDTILTYGRNDYDLEREAERQVSAVLTTTDRITARTDGDQFAASASGGYDLSAGALTFGPIGRVNYVRVHIDGYAERGPAASSAARVADQTVESLTTALGAHATYAISTGWGVLVPLARAEWEHEFKGQRRTLTGNLLGSPGVLLTTQTASPDRDYFNVAVGLSATFPRGVSAFVHYEEQLGRSNFTNHSFTGGVRFEF
jgi:uncharacterized protein YhjY with autotransporter beta-barrel domain